MTVLADVVPRDYRRGDDKALDYVLDQHAEVLELKQQCAKLSGDVTVLRERLTHYRNRIWLAMKDITEGQAITKGYGVLKDLSDEIEQALQAAEKETSDGND